MTFKPSTTERSQSNEQSSGFDRESYQNHVIEQCGTQDKHRTIPAFISGYYDLGLQPQKNYETLYSPEHKDYEKMKEAVEKGEASVKVGNIYISEQGSKGQWHNDVEIYSKPRPPKKAIAWCFTFPQILVDRDKFHGKDSNPKPLNLIMGGEGWVSRPDDSSKNMNVIQDLMFNQENTNNPSGTWGFGQTTNLHKMGLYLELLNEHNLLTQDKLGEMLGKPLQVRMRVYNKPMKKGGTWFTEELKIVSEVPEGLPVPEFDDSFIHGINFNDKNTPNDPMTVKNLHSRVVNTLRLASNFEGSVIQKELREAGRLYEGNSEKSTQEALEASQQASKPSEGNESPKEEKPREEAPVDASEGVDSLPEAKDDFDDTIPF